MNYPRRVAFFFLAGAIAFSLLLILIPEPVVSAFAPKGLYFSIIGMLIWCAVFVKSEFRLARTGMIIIAFVFVAIGLLQML